MNPWPFSDPPNIAVIANKNFFTGDNWIAYVSHDEDDGGWQFHGPESHPSESDMVLVSLASIAEHDPNVCALADLPLGWRAWRDTKESIWQRAPAS
ncbi:hypothetical protein ACO0LD_26895 [Undibacterium sp. Ji83W]|uniref:hypothetical protein n=1 Tax=Undibacterium sp. Ji83W TaxID=3413043 RepID=UPI003BF218D9